MRLRAVLCRWSRKPGWCKSGWQRRTQWRPGWQRRGPSCKKKGSKSIQVTPRSLDVTRHGTFRMQQSRTRQPVELQRRLQSDCCRSCGMRVLFAARQDSSGDSAASDTSETFVCAQAWSICRVCGKIKLFCSARGPTLRQPKACWKQKRLIWTKVSSSVKMSSGGTKRPYE